MKKNLKKIVDELMDSNFESFIADQILSSKSEKTQEPYFSIIQANTTIDVWKSNDSYELVKSVTLGTKDADFRKKMKKKELLKEIINIVSKFLN